MPRPPIVSRPVRGAIFGYGSIGPLHLTCVNGAEDGTVKPIPDVTVVAVAEPDPVRAAWVPGTVRVLADYETLLRELQVDVVHVCLPHHLHAPATIAAAERGVSVICEKPMALDAAEAQRMRSAIRANGIGFSLISQNRLNPEKVWLKERAVNGELGAIERVDWVVDWFRSQEYYDAGSGWRGRDAEARGGVLSNQAYHTLDLVLWLVDSPVVEVTARASVDGAVHPRIDVPDTVEGSLRFKNGVASSFRATVCGSPKDVICVSAFGRRDGQATRVVVDGTMVLEQNLVSEAPVFDQVGPVLGKPEYGSSHQENIARSYEAFMNGAPPPVDADAGIRVLRVIDAILTSDGRPVKLRVRGGKW